LQKNLVITGSSGLVGSESVAYFCSRGYRVHGVDNNSRRRFFGPDGDTTPNLKRLSEKFPEFHPHDFDVRDRERMSELFATTRPVAIIHAAGQPSHDLARDLPFEDFEINALATLNLLECCRRYCSESPFLFMSTNKVYGDAPNEIPMVELETRWDFARTEDWYGISEDCRIDRSTHSIFGVSKAAADLMVQEYGRTFGIPTACFRAGCLTGEYHAGAEQHGFLAYIARVVKEGRHYRIYGYQGKQVRDNLHAYDVCTLFDEFIQAPRCAEVYNLGGGRANSVSVLEAVSGLESLIGKRITTEYVEKPRLGDHQCYISDLRKLQEDYPRWQVTRSLQSILEGLAREGITA